MANVIDSIQESMEAKGRADKDYHVKAWRSHNSQLYRLISSNEGGLTYERCLELIAELEGYASASWNGENNE